MLSKLALIIGLFIASAALADSDPQDASSLNENGVNYISIGGTVTVLKTEKTAAVVDSLGDTVTVVEYAKSFEEKAKNEALEARRAARQE